MSVSLPAYSIRNLAKVFYDKEMIKQLAVELVANQAEAFIDLASDYPGEYNTFDEVKSCIEGGAKMSAGEYMADLMVEFEEELKAAIAATKVTVLTAQFGPTGIVDVDVSVGE